MSDLQGLTPHLFQLADSTRATWLGRVIATSTQGAKLTVWPNRLPKDKGAPPQKRPQNKAIGVMRLVLLLNLYELPTVRIFPILSFRYLSDVIAL